MSKIIRMNIDLSKGHCFAPRASKTGSLDTFVGGAPIVRAGDNYLQVHTCGSETHIMGIALEGSPTVFNNGKPVHGSGHKIQCGDTANNGSPTVIMDESP